MKLEFKTSLAIGIAFASLLTIVLTAFDGRFHWDEPSFLYIGAYLDVPEILDGKFQPSGIPWFTHSRILHILTIKYLASYTGAGPVLLVTTAVIYGIFWVAGLALLWRLLTEIGKPVPMGVGVLIAAASPISIYLIGKTLPESPAFTFAVLCCYGLWRVSSPIANARKVVLWCVVIALALPLIVLTKNLMVLMIIAFGVALLTVPLGQSRTRLLIFGAASAVAGFGLFLGVLSLLGFSLGQYVSLITDVASEPEPLVSLLLHVGLEAGILFALIPICLLGQQRKLSYFFLIWFAVSTVPLLLIISSVEARYLIQNIPALAGLFALSIEWISQRTRRRRDIVIAMTSVTVATIVLLPNAWLAQLLMAHEVEAGAMDRIVSEMRREAGDQGPVVLCPHEYSTFYYLRVVYPKLDAITTYTVEYEADVDSATIAETSEVRRRVLRQRMIEDTEELQPLLNQPVFYFGFEESFPVANLRRLISYLPGGLGQRFDNLLNELQPLAHLETSWLWERVQPSLEGPLTSGHYKAYQLDVDDLRLDTSGK